MAYQSIIYPDFNKPELTPPPPVHMLAVMRWERQCAIERTNVNAPRSWQMHPAHIATVKSVAKYDIYAIAANKYRQRVGELRLTA